MGFTHCLMVYKELLLRVLNLTTNFGLSPILLLQWGAHIGSLLGLGKGVLEELSTQGDQGSNKGYIVSELNNNDKMNKTSVCLLSPCACNSK